MDIQKGKKKEKEKEGLNEDRTRGLRMTGLQSYALPLSYQSAVLVTPAENSRRIDHSSSPLSSSRPVSIIAFLTLDEKTEQLAKKVLRMVLLLECSDRSFPTRCITSHDSLLELVTQRNPYFCISV